MKPPTRSDPFSWEMLPDISQKFISQSATRVEVFVLTNAPALQPARISIPPVKAQRSNLNELSPDILLMKPEISTEALEVLFM